MARIRVNCIEERQERWADGDKRGRILSNKLRGLLLEIRDYYGWSHYSRKGLGYLVKRCLDEAQLMRDCGDMRIGCAASISQDNFIDHWCFTNSTLDAISVLMDEPCQDRRVLLGHIGPHNRKALLTDLARVTKLPPQDLVSISKSMLDKYSVKELQEYATLLAVQKTLGVK